MSNSLSEQLLKAGLITQTQIDQAEQAKQQQKEKAKEAREQARHKQSKPNRPSMPTKPHKPVAKPETAKTETEKQPPTKPTKQRSPSDLEQFYRERNNLERQEKEAEEKRKRELAERKKQTRQQVQELISANLKNLEEASIRYNFVVGETVKYLYVTEQQQQELADGVLAITFLAGKRCLIPAAVAEQILAIDPDKLIVLNQAGSESELVIASEPVVPEAD